MLHLMSYKSERKKRDINTDDLDFMLEIMSFMLEMWHHARDHVFILDDIVLEILTSMLENASTNSWSERYV